MSQWDWLHPENGDMGTLDASITKLFNARTALLEAKDGASGARDLADSGAWSGDSGTAWRIATLGVVNDIPTVRQALSDASSAISSYTSEVISIQTATGTEKQKLADAMAVLWHFSGITLDPVANTVELIRKAIAQREVIEAEAAIVGLAQRRQAADETLVAALSTALPASWEDQRAAFAAVGLTSAVGLTNAAVVDAMVDMAQRIIDSKGGAMDPAAVQAMNEFLTMWGNDDVVMEQFFEQLDAVGTLELIDALGFQYMGNSEALTVAQQVRSALALVSTGWSDTEAADFAAAMFAREPFGPDGEAWGVDQWAAVGFLFSDSDNTPMGEQFTLAAAQQVDAIERDGGFPLITSMVGYDTGGSALWLGENPDLRDAIFNNELPILVEPGLQDVAGEVFESLALYPDSALEFLADGSPERMQYWFGDRNWADVDHFEAPAALWYAAIQAEDAPPGMDLETAVAQVNSQAMWGLATNGSFMSDYISDDAAWDLGAAIGLNLDSIAAFLGGDQVFTDASSEREAQGPSVVDYLLFGGAEGETRAGPALTVDIIAKLLGEVGVSQQGAESIALSVEVHEQAYFGAAAGNPEAIGQAMERINILTGLVDGSAVGATLADAERDDAASDAAVDAYMALIDKAVGLIPVPGGYFIGQAVGVATGAGSEWLANSWKESLHVYDGVAQAMDTQSDFQAFQAQVANGERLYDALGLEESTTIPPAPDIDDYDDDPEGYIADSESWYESVRAVPEVQEYEASFAYRLYELGLKAGQGILE